MEKEGKERIKKRRNNNISELRVEWIFQRILFTVTALNSGENIKNLTHVISKILEFKTTKKKYFQDSVLDLSCWTIYTFLFYIFNKNKW